VSAQWCGIPSYTGTANEYANDVQQTFDGGYIITGSTDTNALQRVPPQDQFNRFPTWTHTISHDNDEGFSVQQTPTVATSSPGALTPIRMTDG